MSPVLARVEIQPIGRGETMAENGLCGNPWPSAGR